MDDERLEREEGNPEENLRASRCRCPDKHGDVLGQAWLPRAIARNHTAAGPTSNGNIALPVHNEQYPGLSDGMKQLASLGKTVSNSTQVNPILELCRVTNTKKTFHGTSFLLCLQNAGMEERRMKSRSYQSSMANSDPVISYTIRVNVSFILRKFQFY